MLAPAKIQPVATPTTARAAPRIWRKAEACAGSGMWMLMRPEVTPRAGCRCTRSLQAQVSGRPVIAERHLPQVPAVLKARVLVREAIGLVDRVCAEVQTYLPPQRTRLGPAGGRCGRRERNALRPLRMRLRVVVMHHDALRDDALELEYPGLERANARHVVPGFRRDVWAPQWWRRAVVEVLGEEPGFSLEATLCHVVDPDLVHPAQAPVPLPSVPSLRKRLCQRGLDSGWLEGSEGGGGQTPPPRRC